MCVCVCRASTVASDQKCLYKWHNLLHTTEHILHVHYIMITCIMSIGRLTVFMCYVCVLLFTCTCMQKHLLNWKQPAFGSFSVVTLLCTPFPGGSIATWSDQRELLLYSTPMSVLTLDNTTLIDVSVSAIVASSMHVLYWLLLLYNYDDIPVLLYMCNLWSSMHAFGLSTLAYTHMLVWMSSWFIYICLHCKSV